MNKTETEAHLWKGVMTKLDDDTVATLVYITHTDERGMKYSDYVYALRVDKLSDLKAEVAEMNKMENRVKKWVWKGLPKYESIVYSKDDLNGRGARWFNVKIKKLVEWDMFVNLINGMTRDRSGENKNATYAIGNYVSLDGNTIIQDIRESKETLLKNIGNTFTCHVPLKCQKNSK